MAELTKVRDIMSMELHGISDEASLQAALESMVRHGINSLIVWPMEQDEPYGIITSSDVVDQIAAGKVLTETRVGDVDTSPLAVITPGIRIRDAARMMRRLNLRHLAVFNGKEIVGIVSNFDLLKGAAALPRSLPRLVTP